MDMVKDICIIKELFNDDASDLCNDVCTGESDDTAEDLSSSDSEVELEIPKMFTWPSLVWTGVKKKLAVLIFNVDAIVNPRFEQKAAGENYHLAFKMLKTDCKLVRSILIAHGFQEAHQSSADFNILWTGSHLKPFLLRGLLEFQKVNHFPRSYEVTRKDRLFKNIQRMQHVKGLKHFDFVPQTFVIPSEYQDFCAAVHKDKGIWIVKPAASSRGRGIYLVTSPDQVSVDENVVICRYIADPLLINGYKFDIRLYVAVTSFDPLIIYLFEEGLTRFATVKFTKNLKGIQNCCMHLTNYSVNKRSSDYVLNSDADVEDYGNKWSLGALLRYLRSQGIDITALMVSVEDVIIKTLISVELPIASACKMFQAHRGNCFELFGFDILIDENLRPWVLEVNLSPSLACDSPLDLKVKSNMVSDLFSLIGLQCCDPTMRRSQQKGFWNPRVRPPFRARQKCASSAVHTNNVKGNSSTNISTNNSNLILTNDESCLLRHTKEEYDRRGGWVRIFPTPDTWDVYSSYLEFSSSLNHLLHQNLFSDGTKSRSHLKAYPTAVKQRIEHLSSFPNQQMSNRLQNDHALLRANQRTRQYERKLICLIRNMKQEKPTLNCARSIANSTGRRITAIKGTAQLAETTKQNERFKNVDSGLSKCNNQVTDLIAMLKNGLKMSKSQARFAFSSYLTCIKERLMVDNGDQYENGFDAINEQMELVMRFLQRAANSLQTPLNIAISSKLSFSVKRQTLVEKLHEFIEVYNKETEDVNGQMELCLPYPEDDSNFVNDKLFHDFIANATENELEEVLTVFTKINKSAGIFLRSSSQNSREQHLLCGRHKIKSQARSKIHSQEKVQHEIFLGNSLNISKPLTGLLHTLAKKQKLCMDSSAVPASTSSDATRLLAENKTCIKDVEWLLKEKCISSVFNCRLTDAMQNCKDQIIVSYDGTDHLQLQKDMIEQSRALIEESKTKHHVLVAHTHNIQKQLHKDHCCNLVQNQEILAFYAPKPPSKPQRSNQDHPLCRSPHSIKAISNGKKSFQNRMTEANDIV